jgi:hypothetical protein
MTVLAGELRKLLEKTIVEARRHTESGARQALQSLAVERHGPHASMSPEERRLRNRLRARGRQLGDRRDRTQGGQEIARLTHEVAYEQWHRMLFARFLAENGVLVEPRSGVSITIEECEELARERGVDPHALAAQFAQEILPGVFRVGDPVLDVVLAPETRQALQRLLDALPNVVFTADDSLGWTYQFWQTESKEAVNASGEKIGADELPAVTQLFTEPYMVEFLLHNTLGAWWCARNGVQGLPNSAGVPSGQAPVAMDYLRWRDDGRPAGGAFGGWPDAIRDISVLDPCCGSGHFLVAAFRLLVPLRMREEGLSAREACDAVLRDNLFGLELDPRCTQIAAFALALAAWTYPDPGGDPLGYRELSQLNIACSGVNASGSRDEWLALANSDEKLRNGIDRLYTLFSRASELGSLISPDSGEGDLITAQFRELEPLLEQAVRSWSSGRDDEAEAIGGSVQGMARAAELLVSRFTLVATNVPYLGRGKQNDALKSYCEKEHPAARADLATCFVERCLGFCEDGGTTALVTPQNWLFLSTYKHLRKQQLEAAQWEFVVRLGEHGFESPQAAGAFTALMALTRVRPDRGCEFTGLDAAEAKTPADKATALRSTRTELVSQDGQHTNPDYTITTVDLGTGPKLEEYAQSYHGITTTDYPRFGRCFWENRRWDARWAFQQSTVTPGRPHSGRDRVLLWEDGRGDIKHLQEAGAPVVVTGLEAWERRGVLVNQMRELTAGYYTGEPFDTNVAVIVPRDPSHLAAVTAFCLSTDFTRAVRQLNQKVVVEYVYYTKVPFDLQHWQDVADARYPEGLPRPSSDDPRQWVFSGHPRDAEMPLHAAVARLLGYRWPRQLGHEFVDCPPVSADGLEGYAGEDGIVPLASVRGEATAAARLRSMLQSAYGTDWSSGLEQELLASAGCRPGASLDDWLRGSFFEQHCGLFHQRPFIWHVWDGRADGFHALVNAHRLAGPHGEGRRTLEALTYSYLGDWIGLRRADQAAGVGGADARLAAAQDLQLLLEHILDGEPPYDIFVRWKPLHEQPIGWDPDINDGIRINIRPFMNAQLRSGGRKGAGILRWKPNIKWGKDRGKELESLRPREDFPWFWSCPGSGSVDERTDFLGGDQYDGARWNNLHYSNAAKRAARDRAAEASNA